MYLFRICVLFCLFITNHVSFLTAIEKLEIHVALTGHDGNTGTMTHPLRTLTMARDAIRQHKQTYGLPRNGAIVWLHAGVYELQDTFFLEAADSGTHTAPIIYSALPNAVVKIVGGRELPIWKPLDSSTALQRIPEAAREHVRYVNLKQIGVTNYGTIMPRSAMRPMFPAALELFSLHAQLTVAHWPNSSHALCHNNSREQNTLICERAKTWSKDSEIYLHGSWLPQNCDSWECVRQINNETGRIELQKQEPPVQLTQTTSYKAFNVIEELDSPGEWYLDRNTGYLYLWPVDDVKVNEYRISELNTLVCCDNAQHIQFRHVQFACARVCGVEILDGHSIQLQHCHLQNFGNLAVTISGGDHHAMQHCHIAHTGDGAIRLEGGNEEAQQAGHHTVSHCHFDNYARSGLAYRPAVHVYGYRNHVTHNEIHKHAEPAILSFGSEHTIEENAEIAKINVP
jgi:Right handed beta helix region